MTGQAGQSLRSAARELLRSAAEAGVPEAWRLTGCTPREIEMQFRAIAAARQAELERLDLLAWLAGSYMMAAFHAPKRYPRRPKGLRRPMREMTDGQMKRVFCAMAQQGKEEGNGDR